MGLPEQLIPMVTVVVALADDAGLRVPKGTVRECETNEQDGAPKQGSVPMRAIINTMPNTVSIFRS